jgi:GNAT superfamily N-acetyltransferase
MGEKIMSYFKIKRLQKENISQNNVQEFLFNMIKDEFGYGYVPEYHQDIQDMESYYLDPERNNFFMAIHQETGKIIGTIGIRAYDRDFPLFKNVYNSKTTASMWRVFVDKKWRRNGVASTLVQMAENFCWEKGYEEIYLHTHKTVNGSLDFWISNGYQIVKDTGNQLQTVHMEKNLCKIASPCDADGILIFEG